MNHVILTGRLCADPDMRQTSGGTAIASYRLAVDRRYKKEGQPNADFINCIAFGKGAEFAERYLQKGTKIAVEGRIQTGSYTKDDGTNVYTVDIVVEHHEFVEGKKGAASTAPAAAAPTAQQGFGYGSLGGTQIDDGDELPF